MARIEHFLAVGTKLSIRRPNTQPQWYTTVKEVVFAPDTVSSVACPMQTKTKTGAIATVSRIVHQNIEVFFTPASVQTRLVMDANDVAPDAFKQVYSTFQYDIPEGANGPVYPNPSGWLRHIAVRDGWSGWLIKKGAVPLARQFEMRQAGCKVTIRDFAEYETADIVRDIVRSLHDEALVLIESVNARRQKADDALVAAQAEGLTEAEARKRYETAMKSITKETEDKVKAMNEASKSFGLTGAVKFVGLGDVSAIVTKNRVNMLVRAATYRQAAIALATVGTVEATALSNQMMDVNAGDVPVEVIGDMLLDAGLETEADALAQAHQTGVHGASLSNDDTFSLDGTGV